MRTRTALLITAAAIITVGALENPAHAAQALWEQQKNWTIIGDNQQQWCLAEAKYPDGITMRIGRNSDGWNWAIDGVAARKGQEFNVAVATSKNSGVLPGIATMDGLVVFHGINTATIRELALRKSIYVQGLGKYNLPGSYDAMASTFACFKAMSGVAL